nr:hypothetical protein [Micromonospora sp. DSM 115978]
RLWDVTEGVDLAVLRTDSELTSCAALGGGARLAVGGRRGLYLLDVVWQAGTTTGVPALSP